MTVHKIAGIDGPGYADYLTGKGGRDRRGDYYLGRSGRAREDAGAWHGKGAEQIGLSGHVGRDDLLQVWEGRDPHTGQILVARGSTGRPRCRRRRHLQRAQVGVGPVGARRSDYTIRGRGRA